MLVLVMSLLNGTFALLLSISFITFWPEWLMVLVIAFLSSPLVLSQMRNVGVLVSKSSLFSTFSEWCGLYIRLQSLFFLLM